MRQFFLLPLILLSVIAHAQKISGRIADAESSPVEMANVLLMNSSDSALIKVTATVTSGAFDFEDVPTGNYYVSVVAFGFTNTSSDAFEYESGQNKVLGTLTVSAEGHNLSEVQVVFQKPLVQVDADKTILNVDGTINATGLTALELLRKAPGVMVDNNDNVIVKGRSGVAIYIDGKPTPLRDDALADYLKSIQSSNIESIEIITNPSAKFDAAGTAGIINIKLKKNKNFGTNGNVSLGYGVQRYSKYNTSLTLNHRNEKWNLFGTYGNNWGKRWSYMNFERTLNDSIYDQETFHVSDDMSHNFKGGIDHFLNSRNTIGVMVTGNMSDGDWEGNSHTWIGPIFPADTNRVLVATNDVHNSRVNLNYNLNYHYTDTTGKDLTVDADYGTFSIRSNSFQPNTYFDPSEQVILEEHTYRSITPTDIIIYNGKADYEQKLFKGKLGVGFKVSLVETENAMDFYNVDGDQEVLDSARTFSYNYSENINAAYLNYNRKLNKFSLQGGIRAEQTTSEGNLTSFTDVNNKDVSRDYLDFFPSAAINFAPNDTNTISLTYSRRIERPSYQDLNPFEFKLDELTYERGNPFLNPQYTHAIELTHTYMYSLNTSLSYSYTEDFFTNITDTTNFEASYIQQRNLGSQDYLGLNISSPVPLGKTVSLFINLGGGRLHNKADFGEGREIDLSVWTYNSFAQLTIQVPKNLTFEISGWHSGPGIWGGTFVNKPMGSMDIAAKISMFKEKGSLRVAYGDVLNTSYWRSTSDYAGLKLVGRGGWESRQLRINFSYRFGNSEIKTRDRKGGADDLGKRVK